MRNWGLSLLALGCLTLPACERTTVEGPDTGLSAEPIVSDTLSAKPKGSIGTGTQEVPYTVVESRAEAADFLRRAGLGGHAQSIDALAGTSAVNWVERQMAMPSENYRQTLMSRLSRDDSKIHQTSQLFYETLIGSDAELRARMTFALSQIFVVNGSDFFHDGWGMAEWLDTLDRHAFGNYRDLMGDVTRSPIMGRYLTYLGNRKANPNQGREPDENYARELLQLFTIGLVELNPDGTVRLGPDGKPVETYSNEDIVGLARVFTGYTLAGSSHRWRDRYEDAWERPMVMYEPHHSEREKRFLGTVIPENTQGEASVEQALDTIFAHPNVGPFVSRLLIQRFMASDPDPAYVARAAAVFDNGYFVADDGTKFGTGERGDLAATVAAIILDPSFHDPAEMVRESKVREPVLKFVQLARAYRSEAPNLVTSGWSIFADTSDISNRLSQSPLRSPSVFNFYRPGYVAPGTETGDSGLTAPELQIVNEGSAVGYMNFMYDFIGREDGEFTVIPDFSDEVAMADDLPTLLDTIDLKLTAGRMSETTRVAITEVLDALPIRANHEDRDRLSRVRLAVMMTVVSPEYISHT